MSDKSPSNRPQINVRLDKHPDLLDEIKQAAGDRNTTVSQFILDSIKSMLGRPTTTTSTDTLSLEIILAEVDKLIDAKLDERLGEFEGRLLAEVRPDDRQPPPEEVKPDYQAMRDRVLKSLTSGRGKLATTSPQYKTAVKALDKFIEELNTEQSASPENWESRVETFLEETNWHE